MRANAASQLELQLEKKNICNNVKGISVRPNRNFDEIGVYREQGGRVHQFNFLTQL